MAIPSFMDFFNVRAQYQQQFVSRKNQNIPMCSTSDQVERPVVPLAGQNTADDIAANEKGNR